MSQLLKLTSFSENNILDQTQLTADVAPGSGSLTVADANDFTSGFVLIGKIGSKTAELLPANSVTSGTTITLTSNTVLQHKASEPVYAIVGNRLRVYRAANVDGSQPADSAFSLLGPIDIDPNDVTTAYTDAAGGGNYWYKYTFYNSANLFETQLSDSRAVRGSFTVNYCSLDEIRREAGFQNAPYIDDEQIDEKRQRAQDEINGALDDFYDTPFQPPISDYLKGITIRLAAGYLRQAQYSAISNSQINGKAMIDNAEADIKKLIMKERVLTDKSGKALDGPGATGGIEGWPNSSTETAASSEGGAPRVFRMSDIQGQPRSVDASGNPSGNLFYGRRW